MDPEKVQRTVWSVAREQHHAIATWQLHELGLDDDAVRHRVRIGRLFRIHQGIYAVGRRELTREGRWMADVLACGEDAALSDDSAANLYDIDKQEPPRTHVSIPLGRRCSRDGIVIHRRKELDTTTQRGIPTTTVAQTLIDVARTWPQSRVEAAINEADKRDLIHPEALRAEAEKAGRQGAVLRRILDRQTFCLTESELERRLLRIARVASLPKPETNIYVSGYKVDAYWPEFRLVVEADGGRFHRTASQQTRDRRRDQAHLASGLTPVRFTHAQLFYESGYCAATLRAIAAS
jgi:very-short-patch-repair endonuclease